MIPVILFLRVVTAVLLTFSQKQNELKLYSYSYCPWCERVFLSLNMWTE